MQYYFLVRVCARTFFSFPLISPQKSKWSSPKNVARVLNDIQTYDEMAKNIFASVLGKWQWCYPLPFVKPLPCEKENESLLLMFSLAYSHQSLPETAYLCCHFAGLELVSLAFWLPPSVRRCSANLHKKTLLPCTHATFDCHPLRTSNRFHKTNWWKY